MGGAGLVVDDLEGSGIGGGGQAFTDLLGNRGVGQTTEVTGRRRRPRGARRRHARKLNVNHETLRNWVGALRRKRTTPGGPVSADERTEPARLRRRIAELELEREILRDAAAESTGQRNGAAVSAQSDVEAERIRGHWTSLTSDGYGL